MATTLGKRKRRDAKATGHNIQEDSDDPRSFELNAQEIFRRHFEAQFRPLRHVEKPAKVLEEGLEDESGEESDWDGISDPDEMAIEVVEHTDIQPRLASMSKDELRTFMTSKPPAAPAKSSVVGDQAGVGVEDYDPSEAANLKKDLALQRLLTESHLLDSASSPTISGNNRHRATDLRLQALGSKTSILKQEKMPMAHRKGMIAKQSEREAKRRREAKESGIILEKAKIEKKSSGGKRDRGVGAPAVGKFLGGTLKLSKKDIFDIEGPRKGLSNKGWRRGGVRRGKQSR